MYCIILQPFVKCMSGSALGYWHAYRTASLEKYWFVYFATSFRLHLAHWSAGTESKWHASVTPSPTNQDPLSMLWLIGRVCTPGSEFLRAEAAQETGGGGMSVGWSACSWGLLSSQGVAWFMWEILNRLGLKAEGKSWGEMCRRTMRLLWCRWHCEGMLVHWSVHRVAHLAAS